MYCKVTGHYCDCVDYETGDCMAVRCMYEENIRWKI